MNPTRRLSIVLVIVLWISGILLLVAAGASAFLDRIEESFEAGAQRLVYQTDHAAVLRVCREVIANPQAFGFPKPKNGYTAVDGPMGGKPPDQLPSTLRNLNFEFMQIQGDQATIWFGGGFGHWGYSTSPNPRNAEIELIPGLWFWTENRLPRDPSKSPYYRTSKRLLVSGAVSIGVAIALAIYLRHPRHGLKTRVTRQGESRCSCS